jgi:peptide/nickel transport system substrate-binding protein
MGLAVYRSSVLSLIVVAALAAAAPLRAQTSIAVVGPWEIAAADPAMTGYAFTRMEVAQTLVDAASDGRLTPGLATSWSVSENGLVWRFEMRTGVIFHDGTPMDAQAAANSLRIANGKPGVLRVAPILSIDADDAVTLVVRLREPFVILPALLASTEAQILAPASYAEAGEVTQVIGTGPYRIERFEPPQRMLLRRFERYWGPAPAVERTSYLAVARGETRALMAESGDAQIVFTLDPASRVRLARSRRVVVHTQPLPRVLGVKVNAGHPLMADRRAREALSLVINRTGIAKALLRDPQGAAKQMFPPAMAFWRDSDPPALSRNVGRAGELLAELGWTRGSDGVLVRDGRRFAMTLRTFPDRPELPLVAAAIQDQARAAGIELRVAIGNSSEVPSGHRDGSLELALVARTFALAPDPLATLAQDYGPDGGDWGAMNWPDRRVADILAELLKENDSSRAAELRRRAVAILHEELPFIPVAWHTHTAAVARNVENFSIDPFERSYRISQMRIAK